jgi:hypothetical protein
MRGRFGGMMRTVHAVNFVCIAALAVLLCACNREEKDRFGRPLKDRPIIVEYIEIEGVCAEDHVKELAPYAGSIEHRYDSKKDTHDRGGFVWLTKA